MVETPVIISGIRIAVLIFFWMAYYYLTKGRPTRHIGFFHFLLFFVSIYFGSFDLYIDRGATNDRFLISILLYPLLSLLGIILGSMVARRAFLPDIHIAIKPIHRKLVQVTVLLFLSVYLIYLYTLQGNIPLFVSLKEKESMAGHVARYLATKGYRDILLNFGFLYWFPRILIDYFAIFIAVFYYLLLKKHEIGYVKFILILVGLALMSIISNEKYPITKLIAIVSLCAFNLEFPKLNLRSVKNGLLIVILLVTVVGFTYTLVTGDFRVLQGRSWADKAKYIVIEKGWAILASRGVTGQSIPLFMIYKLFPEKYDYFLGRTFTNPHGVLPYEPVALPYLIYASYNDPVPGLRGADPTIFFGEIYANFGLIISLVSMVLFGVLLQLLNGRLSSTIETRKSAFSIAFFYMLMAYLGDFAIGFSVPYFDERVWFFVGFYILGMVL